MSGRDAEALKPRIKICGETAISVELEDAVDPEVNGRVHDLCRRLRTAEVPGVLCAVPTYRALFVHYDPWVCSLERLLLILEEIWKDPLASPAGGRMVEIPVCYGLEMGPDLAEVAGFHGMSEAEVIALHSRPVYQVYMMGFTPGFPYLGGLDPRLHTPRRAVPRKRVAAGSVGIADKQTGIYPIESPGGWRIIGRTPLVLFDPGGEPPFLVEAGDFIRFRPIGREDYERARP